MENRQITAVKNPVCPDCGNPLRWGGILMGLYCSNIANCEYELPISLMNKLPEVGP